MNLRNRIAAVVAACPEHVSMVAFWCATDELLYGALIDNKGDKIQGTTTAPATEQTVFDELLTKSQQLKRDMDSVEAERDIALFLRDGELFSSANAQEKI